MAHGEFSELVDGVAADAVVGVEAYIAEQIAVDETGLVQSDEAAEPIYLGFGLLISWSEVDYVEFAEIPDDGSADDGKE